MAKTTKYILFGAPALILLAAAVFIYLAMQGGRKSELPALRAAGPSTLVLLEADDLLAAGMKMKNSVLWNGLRAAGGLAGFDRHFRALDSLVRLDPEMSQMILAGKVYVLLNLDTAGKLVPVYVAELGGLNPALTVENFIRRFNGDQSIVMTRQTGKAQVRMVNMPSFGSFFMFTVYRGLFIGTFHEAAMEEVILQTGRSDSPDSDPAFERVRATAGKKVDANIYLNYRQIGKFLSGLLAEGTGNFAPDPSGSLASWGEVDLVINRDDILMNGYTDAGSDPSGLLRQFRTEPQPMTVSTVLPYNTSFMYVAGTSGFADHFSRYSARRADSSQVRNAMNKLREFYSVSPEDLLLSWIGQEHALAGMESGDPEQPALLAVIRTPDILKARLSLDKLSADINRRVEAKAYSERYGDYLIGKLNVPTVLEMLFGPMFAGITENYYLLIRDYVVFANDPAHLRTVIDHFYNQKTLDDNLNYKSFSDNISDRSNILLYCNVPKSLPASAWLFGGSFGSWLRNNAGILGNLEGVALQFSYINGMFYTNIYAKHNAGYQEIIPSSWICTLDAPVAGKPAFILNHRNEKLNVLVTDELSNLYLLDHIGRVSWKMSLIEAPQSGFFLVDYYRNGKYQYLFNTENYLYLVDLNGDYVADFPVRLPQKATNGLALFDYEKKGEYRILLALDDNRIYNFDIRGLQVEGFDKIQAGDRVSSPVQHLVAAGQDYLFITDRKGQVRVTNRKGEERIQWKKQFIKASNSPIYLNTTNSKGTFLTTDDSGRLVYLNPDGNVDFTSFGEYSSGHYFYYEDFDGNGSNDFIFVDSAGVTVFDRFKKVLLDYPLPEKVAIEPTLLTTGENTRGLAIVMQGSGEVILLDPGGRILREMKISGSLPVISGSIHNDGKINLISGSGNTLTNYLIN